MQLWLQDRLPRTPNVETAMAPAAKENKRPKNTLTSEPSCKDEARVGQQGSLTYIWSKCGSQPRAPRDQRYKWGYIFGAICPVRDHGAALVLPKANTQAMNLHLAEISAHVSTGAHVVLILDHAGWHKTGGKLHLPANISLLHQQPHSRQLQGRHRALLRGFEPAHQPTGFGRIHHYSRLGKSGHCIGPLVSLGHLKGDEVVCGYHGLVFNSAGRCTYMPAQETINPSACVRAYPVVERYRLLWVWMGDPALADPEKVPDFHWNSDPPWAGEGGTFYSLQCDYRLVIDNLMDLTHETYAHAGSIGDEAITRTQFEVTHTDRKATVTRWMENIEPPPFWARLLGKPGHVDRWQIIHFEALCVVAGDVSVAPTITAF